MRPSGGLIKICYVRIELMGFAKYHLGDGRALLVPIIISFLCLGFSIHRPPTVRVIVGTVGKLTSGWETFFAKIEWRKRGDL